MATVFVNHCPLESPITHALPYSFSISFPFTTKKKKMELLNIQSPLISKTSSDSFRQVQKLPMFLPLFCQQTENLSITHVHFLIIYSLINSKCPASPFTIKTDLNPMHFHQSSLSLTPLLHSILLTTSTVLVPMIALSFSLPTALFILFLSHSYSPRTSL